MATEHTFTLFLPSGAELVYRAEIDEAMADARDLAFLDKLNDEVMESRRKFPIKELGEVARARIKLLGR